MSAVPGGAVSDAHVAARSDRNCAACIDGVRGSFIKVADERARCCASRLAVVWNCTWNGKSLTGSCHMVATHLFAVLLQSFLRASNWKPAAVSASCTVQMPAE